MRTTQVQEDEQSVAADPPLQDHSKMKIDVKCYNLKIFVYDGIESVYDNCINNIKLVIDLIDGN